MGEEATMTDTISDKLLKKLNCRANKGYTTSEVRDVLFKPIAFMDYAQHELERLPYSEYKHLKKKHFKCMQQAFAKYFKVVFAGLSVDEMCELTDYFDEIQEFLAFRINEVQKAYDKCFEDMEESKRREVSVLAIINNMAYVSWRLIKAINKQGDRNVWEALAGARKLAEVIVSNANDHVTDENRQILQEAHDSFSGKMAGYKCSDSKKLLKKTERRCDVCGKVYDAEKRSLEKGWGLCCSRSCAAKKRELNKKLNPKVKPLEIVNANAYEPMLHWVRGNEDKQKAQLIKELMQCERHDYDIIDLAYYKPRQDGACDKEYVEVMLKGSRREFVPIYQEV